jgi:type III secretory pathway component EscR
VRLSLWLLGAAVVFGLLMLATLWFAIPFALALVAAVGGWTAVALRARVGWALVRSWTRRTL